MPTIEKETVSKLDLAWVRSQFPALAQKISGQPAVFLDGPGGTQVPQRVIDAISNYLKQSNANTHGAFATSERTDTVVAEARRAMADFFHCHPEEVVFGPNMTTLTYALSRAVGRDLSSGDEILLTRLDHDANVSTWQALEERGVKIQFADIHESDCTLNMDDLSSKITDRTKLVAVGYASNAVGTINPIKEIVQLAHKQGALVFVDAVHYAPHGPIDVADLGCDFLVCSTYKFFGPHMGVLYGEDEYLERFTPYKLRANSDEIPHRWESGTLNHECIAGITACVEYLADLGRKVSPGASSRREALLGAYTAIQEHEHELLGKLVAGIKAIPGSKIYGIQDPKRFDSRCPTIAVRIDGQAPRELAEKLGRRGFFTWDGNYYAIGVTERLDVEKDGGFLRIGLVHYNTAEEVTRLLIALREIVGGS
ncbi:MAG TPA: cysteine desulfurase-like protein [Terriglobales bacterium]